MKKLFATLLLVIIFAAPSYAMDVTLEWDPNPEPDLVGYAIYRAELTGNVSTVWVEIATVPIGTETYTDAGLPDNAKPIYYITAYNEGGYESMPSNVAFPSSLNPGRVILRLRSPP